MRILIIIKRLFTYYASDSNAFENILIESITSDVNPVCFEK
jgi:hypothetical protein